MRLAAFDSCQELVEDLRKAAKASVGVYGLPGNEAIPEAMAIGGARTLAGTAPASSTNNHEADADEPDIVKTDGRRIVAIDGNVLQVVDAASRVRTGSIDLGMPDGRLLLSGNVALVLGSEVVLVDLSGAPTIVSRYKPDSGTVVDARLTGGTARVVLRTTPQIVFRSNATDFKDLLKDNQAAIDKASAEAWLPAWTLSTGTTTARGHVDCNQVSRPPSYSGGSLLSVLTFDVSQPTLSSGDPITVVADGDTVYSNGKNLYVANDQRWRLDRTPGRAAAPVRQETDLYRFTTSGNQKPVFAASGTVPGFLINQYALSEWDSHLRVATTSQNQSAVRVLNDKLAQVGVVDGLGKNEQIHAVRFLGPRGYVVTFRQTDPLYTLDLSTPTSPKVTGDLKITGYSAHLQPVGDNRLIGIGQEADPTGRVTGLQVALFDVADPAAPRRLSQHQVPGAQSEAEYDPHALLWWPATKLLVVPVFAGDRVAGSAAGAVALRVTDEGISEVGKVARAGVRRSLVIGEVLWSLTDGGLQVSQMSTMEELDWVGW